MAKLPKVKTIKTQIYHTGDALRELTTLRNELVTIRTKIYQYGSKYLNSTYGKSLSDGSPFDIREFDPISRNQFRDDLRLCLSNTENDILKAWYANGRQSIPEIERDIENLTQQLAGLKAALPSPEKVAEVKAEIDSLCEQSSEKVREFRAPYADLKQALTDLLTDLPDEMEAVNNARRVSGVITAEVRSLREAYDLEPNGTPYISPQLSDAEKSCLARQRELHREFNGFFGRLETLLSELETDLWKAFRARESGLQVERQITRLLDKHNLSRDEYFTFTLSEGRQHALLVRLEMFANMIRSNEPAARESNRTPEVTK